MDDVSRLGVDIHNNSPGEELNHDGELLAPDKNPFEGSNYGFILRRGLGSFIP